MGEGYWTTTDSVPDFTEFIIPIIFTSPIDPDLMNISIVTDQYFVGSSVIVDALSFEYEITAIEPTNDLSSDIKLYPNPTTGNLNIQTTSDQPTKIFVFDLMGRLLMNQSMSSSFEQIDLSMYSGNLVVLKIEQEDGVTSRLIKIN